MILYNKKWLIVFCCTFFLNMILYFQDATAQLSKIEQSMIKNGLVDIHSVDTSIHVSLMYSRPDNFCKKVLYKYLTHAYLHPKAAAALKKAQKYLREKYPELRLIVFDAGRPMSIQQQMWNAVKNTAKSSYVSNPAHGGGLHNYGMAVDISICNVEGDTIPMGTKIDYMGKKAHIDCENQLVKSGKLTRLAIQNRRLLRSVMHKAGFKALRTEWWHFNMISRAMAKRYYKVIK